MFIKPCKHCGNIPILDTDWSSDRGTLFIFDCSNDKNCPSISQTSAWDWSINSSGWQTGLDKAIAEWNKNN